MMMTAEEDMLGRLLTAHRREFEKANPKAKTAPVFQARKSSAETVNDE
jgi:hypothetical protein